MSFHDFNISYGLNVFLFLLALLVGLIEIIVIVFTVARSKMSAKKNGLSILVSILGIIPSTILLYGITHLNFS